MKTAKAMIKVKINNLRKPTSRIKRLTKALEKLTIAMDNYNEVFLEHKDLINEMDLINSGEEK